MAKGTTKIAAARKDRGSYSVGKIKRCKLLKTAYLDGNSLLFGKNNAGQPILDASQFFCV